MPLEINHDFKEKYPYIRAGTLEPMHNKDILTKTFFMPYASVLGHEKDT